MDAHASDEVPWIDGRTRMYAIVGDPIEQVRSPQMVTWSLRRRGANAVLVPLHVRAADFDDALPRLMRVGNLDGLIFTIPFKAAALALADELGPQAATVGALNALARGADGRWRGEAFDGQGCVEGLRRAGAPLAGRSVLLLGAGGAGAAIAVAVAAEGPRRLRIHEADATRAARAVDLARRIAPALDVAAGPALQDDPVAAAAALEDVDVLVNATPVGMLGDPRRPLAVERLPARLAVLDAVVDPERTPLLELARACGARAVPGREMMRGQIERIVDFFEAARGGRGVD